MRYAGRWIAVGLLLAAPVLHAQNPASPLNPASPNVASPNPAAQPAELTTTPAATTGATTPRPHHKSRKAQKELVLPPLPSGPLSQVPMEQIPASPAKVSYQDGLLTIVAQNSTLSEILRDVRKLTGATIEIPQGAGASERVVAHLGPGAPRDVLAGLLNGSSFNYVMLGTSTDPTALASVMLLAKTSTTAPGETQTAANTPSTPLPNSAPGMPPGRLPPTAFNRPGVILVNDEAATTESDDSKDDDQDAADDNADDQAQPQPGQADATIQDQPQPMQTPTPADPNQPNAGPRTPEQVMQMLRNQQQPGTVIAPPPPQPPQQ